MLNFFIKSNIEFFSFLFFYFNLKIFLNILSFSSSQFQIFLFIILSFLCIFHFSFHTQKFIMIVLFIHKKNPNNQIWCLFFKKKNYQLFLLIFLNYWRNVCISSFSWWMNNSLDLKNKVKPNCFFKPSNFLIANEWSSIHKNTNHFLFFKMTNFSSMSQIHQFSMFCSIFIHFFPKYEWC